MSSFGSICLLIALSLMDSRVSGIREDLSALLSRSKCDSDCVVSCFQNQKVWQNKCLLICGCENTPPSKSDEVQNLPELSQSFVQSLTEQPSDLQISVSDCDSECFTLCAIYNSGKNADYSDCWSLCNCQTKQTFLGQEQTVEESGVDVGLIAGIIWLAFLAVAFIAWCRCDSRSPEDLSEDLELLLKERQEQMNNLSKYSFSIPGTSLQSPTTQRRNTISLPHISGHDLNRRCANSISIQ